MRAAQTSPPVAATAPTRPAAEKLVADSVAARLALVAALGDCACGGAVEWQCGV